MDRTLYWDQNQQRTFDLVQDDVDKLVSQANLSQDFLGSTLTVCSGLTATQTGPASLSINLTAGRIYQIAPVDAVANGAIVQNLNNVLQQGWAAAQQVTLSTAGLTSGQSRWSLVQAQFSQIDIIRPNDPNGGLLFFYNASNPSQPFEGPGNDGETTPTVREGVITFQVLNGAAATTGSEVPPTPTTGWIPLYLIDLSFGQTTITTGEILVSGPSVGTNVPSNYPQAPFLAGLLNSHHSGINGQAPKIHLTSEVQGVLPLANMPASNTAGGLSTMRLFGGNPNGSVAGNANINGASDMCYDTTDGFLYICTTTGTTSTAVWTNLSTGTTANYNGGTSGGSANAQTIAATTPSGFSLTVGNTVTFIGGFTNTGATTLNVDSTGAIAINKLSGGVLVPLTGSEIAAGGVAVVTYTGTVYELQASGLGTAAYQNVSAFYQTSNNLSEIPAASAVGTAQGNLQLLALTTTGSANAYVMVYSPAPGSLVTGQTYRGIANFSNTGPATLNINSLGAKAITKNGLNALVGGEIQSGQAFEATYDGTRFQLVSPSLSPPVVTSATNVKASITSPSASGLWTADEIVLKTALGGSPVTLASYSKTVNLSTTGAGGMDTGSPPSTGFVSVYAIYGTSGTSILACNVSTSNGSVYSGGNMPAGYIYSALLGILPVASSVFPICFQANRLVSFQPIVTLNAAAAQSAYTSFSLSASVPPGATSWSGSIGGSAGSTPSVMAVAADASGTGEQLIVSNFAFAPPFSTGGFSGAAAVTDIPVITAQTGFYKSATSSTSNTVSISSYRF